MAVRILWDKYEAAILLDACLRVERGEIERIFAITYVSNILRKRAELKGIKIDSIFRNENGIGMQFSAMSNCLHHKSGGLTISSLFRETVELYESDRESFQRLVQEAIELNPENNKENTFAVWLKEQPEYLSMTEKIIRLINIIGVLWLKAGVISEPIIKITSEEKVTQLLDALRQNKVFHIHSRKQLQEYIYAVEVYLDYLRKNKKEKLDIENTILQEKNDSLTDTCLESKWKAHYTEDIGKLLEKYYAYGFRVGSPIEIMRFRNYAGNDNIVIPDLDEDLEREISAAGTLIDGKIFVFRKSFLTELIGQLNEIFSNGIDVIFLEPFMEKNLEWLENNYITNTELLKEILLRNCKNFYYGQNMITQGKRKTEQEAVVSEIHRVSGGSSVVWFSDLCNQLEYVPPNKIALSLSASDDFVWISEGKYFVMRFFLINDNETAEICKYVANECAENGYASISDLPFGEIPEKNYELSVTALHSAVFISVLKGHYNLNGKILTHEENSMSMNLCGLLKKYCEEHTECTVTEVMEKAFELTGGANRQNSFAALYDVMVRVGKNQFVSESQVRFNVNQIDSVLQNIIGNRFAPIKSVTTFALFSTCGQNWNHYLLESFCHRFSRMYRLCVLNYNDKNVGIIVSKTLSLNYNDMLCESVARTDIKLTLENVGKYFVENGLTAKKKFASLPDIVKKAIEMREEV